jgi:hypothetical protein
MKSKKDLQDQIQRIYKNYPNSKLYPLAQSLVVIYNHNMSMTDTNKDLHRRYMASYDKDERQILLGMMMGQKYDKSVYAVIKG